MTQYPPGQGISDAALERLRKLASSPEAAKLPAQDSSKQWLGFGFKMRPRCGACTRPLGDVEVEQKLHICLHCSPSVSDNSMKEQRSMMTTPYRPGHISERLRKLASGGVAADLPAQDMSKQWLGFPKKKPRCEACTRPLGDAEVEQKLHICFHCSPSTVTVGDASMRTLYRPGQGISGPSLERLRERKLADLRSQESSKQWDHLYGPDAQKKPHCGACTRPLGYIEVEQKLHICLQCDGWGRSMRTPYPAQGISHAALELWLAQELALASGGVAADLPTQDTSKQCDHLHGPDAEKKPRCEACTRPLGDAEVEQKLHICFHCSPSTVTVGDASMRTLYRPGQGISGPSLERLRERKLADLRSQDTSKQCDYLHGPDAEKKPRCVACTRPLGDTEVEQKLHICLQCSPSTATAGEERESKTSNKIPTKSGKNKITSFSETNSDKPASLVALPQARAEITEGPASCVTPSTAVSEDSGASAQNSPRAEDSPASRASPEEQQQQQQQQQMLMLSQKGLEGTWLGEDGETYTTYLHAGKPMWICIMRDSAGGRESFSLSFDEHENKVWWGSEKTFFLDASELREEPAHFPVAWEPAHFRVAWYSAADQAKRRPQYFWHRAPSQQQKEQQQQQQPQQQQQQQQPSKFQGFDTYALDKQCAIRDLEEKLTLPSSDGHVHLPQWDKCYLQSLGTLREFLEKCPEKFKVVPGHDKWTYTVALVGAGPSAQQKKVDVCFRGRWKALGDAAIAEITQQLADPGRKGFVWIKQWSQSYQRQLGSLRSFLQSRPDKFKVIPTSSSSDAEASTSGFRVELAAKEEEEGTLGEAAIAAIAEIMHQLADPERNPAAFRYPPCKR
ncbi:unnamed protein product [Polarella glacialis]|uniref:Uncharacterized protein n=1 Tax=Polarella glacialis TaxID=89957 RepID=A0A813DYH3_POLGL|nr:unnamed protein product [Polarella glacialis]